MPSILSALLCLGQIWRAGGEYRRAWDAHPPFSSREPQGLGSWKARDPGGKRISPGFHCKYLTSRAVSGTEDPECCRWFPPGLLRPMSHLSPENLVGAKWGICDTGETWKGSCPELGSEEWGGPGTQPLTSFQGPSTNPRSGLRFFGAASKCPCEYTGCRVGMCK